MARSDAILASASVASLYFLNTWLSSRPSNFFSRRWTALQYASILGSWQLDSFMTWSMMSLESPRTSSRLIPSSAAMWRPLTRASYYAALFEAGKWSRITYRILTLRGEMKRRPTPAPVFFRDRSKYKVLHSNWIYGGGSWVPVHSAIESAKTWDFIAFRGS